MRRRSKELTKVQRRVLRVLADGGVLCAAFNYPETILNGGSEFSEAVKIRVLKVDGAFAFCVRNKTAYPLYERDFIACHEGSSGDREFTITEAGRAAA